MRGVFETDFLHGKINFYGNGVIFNRAINDAPERNIHAEAWPFGMINIAHLSVRSLPGITVLYTSRAYGILAVLLVEPIARLLMLNYGDGLALPIFLIQGPPVASVFIGFISDLCLTLSSILAVDDGLLTTVNGGIKGPILSR